MKRRRIIVTLEIETDHDLDQLQNKTWWQNLIVSGRMPARIGDAPRGLVVTRANTKLAPKVKATK